MKGKLFFMALTALATAVVLAFCLLPMSFADDSWHDTWNPSALSCAADSTCTDDSELYTNGNSNAPSPWSAGRFDFTVPGDELIDEAETPNTSGLLELCDDAETVDTWEMRHPQMWPVDYWRFSQPWTLEQALGLAPITPIARGFRGRQ